MSTDYDQQQEERPPQHQPRQPGVEAEMEPAPVIVPEHYRGSGKLEGKRALITPREGDALPGRTHISPCITVLEDVPPEVFLRSRPGGGTARRQAKRSAISGTLPTSWATWPGGSTGT